MAAYTTIDNPELYFQTKLWTGTGSTNALTLDGETDMQPDLVWIKLRAGAADYGHRIFDSVRGVHKTINSSSAAAEGTETNTLTVFGSDGFTVVDADEVNQSGGSYTYVAWCWKESATAGFDIISMTGTGSARTQAHSLSAVPKMIIVKCLNDGNKSWAVYHAGVASDAETDVLALDATDAPADDATYWNDTAPTSSVFTVGTANGVNKSTKSYIAYVFAPIQGFSKFGSYTGNGNADGPFIYTGFRPARVMIKGTANTWNWNIIDNKRNGYNGAAGNKVLQADNANGDSTEDVDILSNGFKIRDDGNRMSQSGYNYIYMAFAEAPFVNSNGVPCNAR